MTTINPTSSANHVHRSQFSGLTPEAKEAHAAHEASGPHADPRIRQLQTFVDNLARAIDRRANAVTRYMSQLSTSLQFSAASAAQLGLGAPPSAVGPQVTEVVAHPEMLEELKKHREREARLSADARSAIEGTERPMVDMLRIFGFLDFLDNPYSPDSREDKTQVGDEPIINPHDKDASGLIWDSHSEFYEMIGQLIASLQQNWLSKYQDAMKVFLDFYEKFSDAMDKIEVGKPSNGKEDIQLNFDKMRNALKALLNEFSGKPMASFSTEAGAEAFIASLNLPGLEITKSGGEFHVMINLDSVQEILQSLKDGNGNDYTGQIHWSPAKYNAWLSAKDGSVEDIKHVSKVLGEKLNEVTQKFDNIVKILSSTIDKITEADMSFVRGL